MKSALQCGHTNGRSPDWETAPKPPCCWLRLKVWLSVVTSESAYSMRLCDPRGMARMSALLSIRLSVVSTSSSSSSRGDMLDSDLIENSATM